MVTKVFQISHLKHWWTKTIVSVFKKDAQKKEAGSVSRFQTLCTALAATIGAGNIAGVAIKTVIVRGCKRGALMSSSIAWDISDTFNGMMMIPNLIGVVVLSPVLIKIVRNYVDRKIKGKVVTPVLSYDETIQKEMEEAVNNGEE